MAERPGHAQGDAQALLLHLHLLVRSHAARGAAGAILLLHQTVG
eukprot:CAMPEP_0180682676 /NCGR_PEP_ID=MMETSP1037_2-20121125/70692_1 /TAXON_ID=632150 /ORGANISM="Azadinium spinosum, Strain 3D9" /LENGTH=43 /DNA_ID= /DNA_START= /DNA_END= /DNA_ORIENTATION=